MTILLEADKNGTMLTEKEAWNFIKEVFEAERAPASVYIFYGLNLSASVIFGMCDIIQFLEGNSYITGVTHDLMIDKIKKSMRESGRNPNMRQYLFDEDDRESRVKYCQERILERIQEIKNEEVQKNV